MNKVYEILEFNFSPSSFANGGKNPFSLQIQNQLKSRISILKRLSESLDGSYLSTIPANGIEEAYLKFQKLKQDFEKLKAEFDRRELRTLTYALNYANNGESSIYGDADDLTIALILLDNNWRDSFIPGLLDCFLSNWNNRRSSSFYILSEFLLDKIKSYEGTRSPLIALKDNLRFFDKNNGDLKLGYEMFQKNLKIFNASKHLGLSQDKISYPYFSRVIDAFVERATRQLKSYLNDINLFLETHSNGVKGTATNKLVVSKIICKIDDRNIDIQDQAKDMAFSLVGDPGINSLWLPFDGATEREVNTINKAKSILNQWLTKQFINVFFEKCIDDPRRKVFWLKHAKDISSFKVFGSKRTMYFLKRDERISEFVEARFSLTYSRSDVSAFIMYLKNHVLIEFSQDGYAFIGYRKGSQLLPDLTQRFSSVNDLRAGELPMAVRRKYETIEEENEEGRLFHKDGNFKNGSSMPWEVIFNHWLKKHVL